MKASLARGRSRTNTGVSRAGIPAERALMVGDSFEADYLGAREAGLHAILLRREGSAAEACPTIRSLSELEARLAGGRSRGQESRAKAF